MSEGFPAASGAAEPSPESFTSPALIKTEQPEEDARSFDHEVVVERVKSEPEQLLYADHKIKEEMVIGRTEIRRPVPKFCHQYIIATLSAIKTSSLEYENARLYHCRVELWDAREELQCAECGQWSLTAAELQRHKRMHTEKGNQPVLIQLEERQTAGCKGSNRELKLTKGKSHTCDHCDRQFRCKSALTSHQYTHSKVRLFACDICNQNFNRRSNLNKHLSIHSSIKRFMCDICDRRFNFKDNVKQHLLIHNGVKRFTCNICGKKFLKNWVLKNHLVVHKKIKPQFECHICDKKFTRKNYLRQHLKIHQGVKPFECNTCDKRFYFKYLPIVGSFRKS